MKKGKAGFIMTGHWTQKAFDEAQKYGQAVELASSADKAYSYIPDCNKIVLPDDLDYVHICENNTIYGTRYYEVPDSLGKNIVSDMSSCILSEPINVSKYALIFAGAQKNMGPAGVTVVIVRKDLVTDEVLPCTPSVMKYKNQADNDCRYNTPPTYGIYMCGKMFKWIKEMGGLSTMQKLNREKAKLMYDYIDQSRLFHGTADPQFRSTMNATFTTGKEELDMTIVEDSKKHGFVSLKGHRFVGGLRATMYNAIPIEHVDALVKYLKQFEVEYLRR
jgi:phosphoserine aminotransferase